MIATSNTTIITDTATSAATNQLSSSARRRLRTMSSAECRFRPAMCFILPSGPTSGHRTLKLAGLIQWEEAILVWICPCPPRVLGGTGLCVCSAVSYFSTRVGSIIGAGRLSFRVRDGSGRFPVAVAAVTFFKLCWWWGAVVCAAGFVVACV